MQKLYALIIFFLVQAVQPAIDADYMFVLDPEQRGEHEELLRKEQELLWKLYKPAIETIDIPYTISAPEEVGEGEYLTHVCAFAHNGDVILTSRFRRHRAYYLEGLCCCCFPRVSYEGSLSSCMSCVIGCYESFLGVLCGLITMTPDMPLDGLHVFRYFKQDEKTSWTVTAYHDQEDVMQAHDTIDGLALKNEKVRRVGEGACNFLVKNGTISAHQNYFWGTNLKKVACVVPGEKKLYILTRSEGVSMDVAKKGYDCCIKFE